MPLCVFCHKEIVLTGKPGRTEECPHCRRDLHCCLQCQFYDPKSHHECRESQAEFVADKDRANFCDYFVFDPQTKVKSATKETMKSKADAWFKK